MAAGSLQKPAPGLSSDQARGLALACSSAIFIGSSFIIKKKGLRVAGSSGTRAGPNTMHWPAHALLPIALTAKAVKFILFTDVHKH